MAKERRQQPEAINLELTSRCNLKCDFCLNPKDTFRQKNDMCDETFDAIIGSFAPQTKFMICGIGEPTLHPDFKKFSKILTDKFKSVELVTNGTTINRELANFLVTIGFQRIIVSLDNATEESYKKHKKGLFNKVITGINNLLDAKLTNRKGPNIQINVLMRDGAMKDILAAFDLFGSRLSHNDCIYTRMIKDLGGSVENFAYKSDLDSLIKMKNKLENKGIDTEKFKTEIFLEVPFKRTPCKHLEDKYAMITQDGEVLPCCVDFNATMSMGNIKENSFQEIWNGDKFKKLLIANSVLKYSDYFLCANCNEWYKC